MALKHRMFGALYRTVFKPVAFGIDPEFIHNLMSGTGESLEYVAPLVSSLFSYNHPSLRKHVLGVEFANPVGLSAGFDNDGHVAKIVKYVGFGFNTVGTVTARANPGNPRPRLARLRESKSLLVNKGFRNEGADTVARRLDSKNLMHHTIGISVGSTNLPDVDSIPKAIDDYLYTFSVFAKKPYVKYFELNISCPNTSMTESFTEKRNFTGLVHAVSGLNLRQPVFVKMPNEIPFGQSDDLVRLSLADGIRGFIFANLVKDRKNPAFAPEEIAKLKGWKGNFSGKPAEKNANALIEHTRQAFGREVAIIGVGGIFSAGDAVRKLEAGADLVQLITGMIFEGPQLIGEICDTLVHNHVYETH